MSTLEQLEEAKTNSNINNESAPLYPTGKTVPFPYERPYPVQVALMDAMLQALSPDPDLVDENEGVQTAHYSCGDPSADDNSFHPHCSGKNKMAKVILLESPTGTGKSLSLGCASLAWLRYMQRMDMSTEGDNNTTSNDKTNVEKETLSNDNKLGRNDGSAVASAGAGKDGENSAFSRVSPSSALNWIDAWAPTTKTSEDERRRREDAETRRRASVHRGRLEKELEGIRQRIDRAIAITTRAYDGGVAAASTVKEARAKVAGEAVKKAVQSSAQQSCRHPRVVVRKKHCMLGLHERKNGVDESRSGMFRMTDEDFCVEDYESDTGGAPRRQGYDVPCDSSEDSDDDRRVGGSQSDSVAEDTNSAKQLLASSLLDGGLLDGSSPSSTFSSSPALSSSSNSLKTSRLSLSSSSKACTAVTVGGVTPGSGVRKIVYAARTHSQLSQFVGEIRRVPEFGKTVRVVTLGGRKLLCGNSHVLGSPKQQRGEDLVTERCLDLQKGIGENDSGKKRKRKKGRECKHKDDDDVGGDGSTGGCPLLKHREAVSTLELHSLARPTDIEDVAALGKKTQICAYYASRDALPAAELVVLPYSTLLSPAAREAVGLTLEKALVIIDEAHNIPEALRSLSACRLSLPVARVALTQLEAYVAKYSSRLVGRNLFYLGQIRRCLNAIVDYLRNNVDTTVIKGNKKTVMLSSNELLFTLCLDNVNLFKIDRYLTKSRLPQKLLGFTNHKAAADDSIAPAFLSKHVSAMSIVQDFFKCLTSDDRMGKIVAEWPDANPTTMTTAEDDGVKGRNEVDYNHSISDVSPSSSSRGCVIHPTLRYVLVDPASKFVDGVVREAHAVVLAGGTLRPFAHVTSELLGSRQSFSMQQVAAKADKVMASLLLNSADPFQTIQSKALTAFSCGHVVPSSHVFLSTLSVGPTSTKLDFRHGSRCTDSVCDELGRTLWNLVHVVPSGLIVFIPSYTYEAHLVRRWRRTGLLSKLGKKKTIHREPKDARDVEKVLEMYSRDAISSSSTKKGTKTSSSGSSGGNGALLLCVIGGKMSEGINFADAMARCVVVVGLPYPDVSNPELVEKMSSLDREAATARAANARSRGSAATELFESDVAARLHTRQKCSVIHTAASFGSITGREYYQNLCMRAVNQSVGRAIRHANDYAAVILADYRYAASSSSNGSIWTGLPQWLRMGNGTDPRQESFGKVIGGLRMFFRERAVE